MFSHLTPLYIMPQIYGTPTYNIPIYNAPIYNTPLYDTPTYDTPIYIPATLTGADDTACCLMGDDGP